MASWVPAEDQVFAAVQVVFVLLAPLTEIAEQPVTFVPANFTLAVKLGVELPPVAELTDTTVPLAHGSAAVSVPADTVVLLSQA